MHTFIRFFPHLVVAALLALFFGGSLAFVRVPYNARTLKLCSNIGMRKKIFSLKALIPDNLDRDIVFSLSSKGVEAFNQASNNYLTRDSVRTWERKVDSLTSELKLLNRKEVLLLVYGNILEKSAPQELDPLQVATFEVFSRALADNLVKNRSPEQTLTDLVDEVTEVHLDFIEKFQKIIDDGGSDG